jgi:release factor glutamine methyltransferase
MALTRPARSAAPPDERHPARVYVDSAPVMSGPMRIIVLPGVFRPISDTWLLARTLCRHTRPGTAVLDLCSGSGAIAIAAARTGATVTAVDVSRRAVATIRINAMLNDVEVEARRSDLFSGVGDRRFDVIVSNPPYVPDPTGDRLPTRGPRRAWDAGRDGRAILDRLIDEAPAHLRPGGTLLVVHSDICGEGDTRAAMAAAGLRAAVVARHRGPLGPLMGARVAHLQGTGALAPGVHEEDMLVIAGRLDAPRHASTMAGAAKAERAAASPQG